MSISHCATESRKSQSSNGDSRIYSDDGTRVIGIVRNYTFTKSNWHSTKHLCWKHKAIGLDHMAFLYQVEPFASQIVVLDKDTGKEYRVSMEVFKQLAIEDDLGWGLQLFLPLKYWEVTEPDGSKPLQLPLWEACTK